jgi:copper(I)-binding protein
MRPNLLAAIAAALLLPLCAAAQQPNAPAAHGEHMAAGAATLGDLVISGAVARASIGNAPTSAAYMTITTSGEPDRLVAAASPAAQAVELHTSLQEGGVSKMQRVDAVPVAPGAPAELAPGGHHLMLIGLAAPLEEGTTVPLTLTFEGAGEITVDVPVSKDIAAHAH